MKLLGKGCLVLIGVFVVLGVLGALVGTNGVSEESVTSQSPALSDTFVEGESLAEGDAAGQEANPAGGGEGDVVPVEAIEAVAEPEPQAYGIGQDVQVGDVRWQVIEAVDIGSTLTSENQYIEDYTTAGKFVRVRFQVENLTSDQLFFSDVDLVDSQGRSFKHATDFEIMMHMPNEEQCALEQLNPNVPQICQMIFELPMDATGLQMTVGDLVPFTPSEARITLGI